MTERRRHWTCVLQGNVLVAPVFHCVLRRLSSNKRRRVPPTQTEVYHGNSTQRPNQPKTCRRGYNKGIHVIYTPTTPDFDILVQGKWVYLMQRTQARKSSGSRQPRNRNNNTRAHTTHRSCKDILSEPKANVDTSKPTGANKVHDHTKVHLSRTATLILNPATQAKERYNQQTSHPANVLQHPAPHHTPHNDPSTSQTHHVFKPPTPLGPLPPQPSHLPHTTQPICSHC